MSEHAQILKGGHVVPHHFENAKQAFESSKLGLWVFLITELLLFGGLFVGYIILRSLYPDMFLAASTMLDRTWGAVNTVVLICSSFTVAMAIETIKQNKRGLTTVLLLITLVCAGIFMVVKYQEYHHKFEKGVAPISKLEDGTIHVGFDKFNHALFKEHPNANLFFGLYFMMTGVHGIHVLVGMFLIFWVMIKNIRGRFSDEYYTPIELTGLYWHLVDLIWIFLFPLMYLIGHGGGGH